MLYDAQLKLLLSLSLISLSISRDILCSTGQSATSEREFRYECVVKNPKEPNFISFTVTTTVTNKMKLRTGSKLLEQEIQIGPPLLKSRIKTLVTIVIVNKMKLFPQNSVFIATHTQAAEARWWLGPRRQESPWRAPEFKKE
jgi:hypothetical protein